MNELFSDRISLIGTENAFKVAEHIARAQQLGIDVIKFNLGEPDFDTARYICDVAAENIFNGNTHYCPPNGLLSLRRIIATQVSVTRNIRIDPDLVVITTGAKPPIAYSMLTYVNPGDEVIYPSPGFPIYESWITFVGAKPVPVHLEESKGFSFTAEDLEPLITSKTKLIFINSPSNPTGGVLSIDELKDIAYIINKKANPNVRIYSDEVYEYIVFDGIKHASIISISGMQDKTVLVSGHSKTFAMTGWRLGFAILPTKEEADIFKNLNINIISCTPPFIQEAGRHAYESKESEKVISNMVEKFRERRDYAVPALNAINGITCSMPKGAFYVFPNIEKVCHRIGVFEAFDNLAPEIKKKTNPSKLFQLFLLYRYGVATMDRKSFGSIGADNKHYLRISIATSLPDIKRGLELISKAAYDINGFKNFINEGKYLY